MSPHPNFTLAASSLRGVGSIGGWGALGGGELGGGGGGGGGGGEVGSIGGVHGEHWGGGVRKHWGVEAWGGELKNEY